MEPAQLAILAKALVPIFAVLIVFGMPVVILFTLKHFKLRHRELELDAEMHGKQTQTRLASIEARLGVIESALGALARGQPLLQARISTLEPPARPADEPAAAEANTVR